MRLLPKPAGHIEGTHFLFDGRDLLRPVTRRRCEALAASDIAMIFQDPMTSLNPVLTIGEQIVETIRAHDKIVDGRRRGGVPLNFWRWLAFPTPEAAVVRSRTSSAEGCASGR